MSLSDHLSDLPLHKQNIRYSGVNCALGLSKSICYSRDFLIAGFVSRYFIVILPGFQMLFIIGVFIKAGFVIAGCHCIHHIITDYMFKRLLQ